MKQFLITSDDREMLLIDEADTFQEALKKQPINTRIWSSDKYEVYKNRINNQ
jgi:hypothetical protein